MFESFCLSLAFSCLTDSLREEAALVSGCFGVQSSVAPPRGEKVKQFDQGVMGL